MITDQSDDHPSRLERYVAATRARQRLLIVDFLSASSAPSDPRRIAVLVELRNVLEQEFGVEFTFADSENGEGVRLLRHRS